MRIGITGVPGTGKTTLAKALSEIFSLEYVSINDVVNEKGLWTEVDPTDGAKIVNLRSLERVLQDLPEDCVVEGHLLCEVRLPLDLVIVLRLDPERLEKRLSERGYSEDKLRANIYSELIDYCTNRALRRYDRVYELVGEGDLLPKVKAILEGKGESLRASSTF